MFLMLTQSKLCIFEFHTNVIQTYINFRFSFYILNEKCRFMKSYLVKIRNTE